MLHPAHQIVRIHTTVRETIADRGVLCTERNRHVGVPVGRGRAEHTASVGDVIRRHGCARRDVGHGFGYGGRCAVDDAAIRQHGREWLREPSAQHLPSNVSRSSAEVRGSAGLRERSAAMMSLFCQKIATERIAVPSLSPTRVLLDHP